MSVDILNKTRTRINTKLVQRASEAFLKKYKKNKLDLSIVFVGDRKIRKINNLYRRYDKVTDILSFEGEDDSFGELIIDYAQIKRQASRFGNSTKDELIFILVHGLFHLLGYNDETEKEELKMIKLGEDFIKKMKI